MYQKVVLVTWIRHPWESDRHSMFPKPTSSSMNRSEDPVNPHQMVTTEAEI
uniref:Uncharacterized protein n=1 Tax=Phlebotomus papatasi TaxID=29031 RepID=A0A1B0DCY0_PHLPP